MSINETISLTSEVIKCLCLCEILKYSIDPLKNSCEDHHCGSCATQACSTMNQCFRSWILIIAVKVYKVLNHIVKSVKFFSLLRNVAVWPPFKVKQSDLFRLLINTAIFWRLIKDTQFVDSKSAAHLIRSDKAHRYQSTFWFDWTCFWCWPVLLANHKAWANTVTQIDNKRSTLIKNQGFPKLSQFADLWTMVCYHLVTKFLTCR